ncbi:MAG: hypothetical protein AB7I36_08205 [Rhodospirillaceae bacterium]
MLSAAGKKRYAADCQKALDALAAANGNKAQAARTLGWAETSLKQRLTGAKRLRLTPSAIAAAAGEKKAEHLKPLMGGRDGLFETEAFPLPRAGKVSRYILTAAQNNTQVNAAVWDGLLALADHYDAKVLVSRFTYNKGAYASAGRKVGSAHASDFDDLWFDPLIEGYESDKRVCLAPGLMWCGEANIMPTAERPLSGFESYTGRNSGIFPHTKIAMQSIASAKMSGTKFNYTTAAVTQRNYIQRKAGLKAEFHHAYGALLVEVDDKGNWWCRQINADKSGTFYDLDVKVERGKLNTGHRVEAITWGDVHVAQIDPTVRKLAWGKGGMLDALRPHKQFFHDVLDMHARNHHDAKDPHEVYRRFVEDKERVADEVALVGLFFSDARRSWCESISVESNHNQHMGRWLREADWRRDPVNAEFYLEAQAATLRAIRTEDRSFNLLRWAVERSHKDHGVRFLNEDESYILCPKAGDGIECGMHGHAGPNGTRASPLAFARMGRKANVGHSHSAGIYDGVYVAGTSSRFDLGYNKGPSSWSHSHILTYSNGKRAIVTMWDGKWRA